jgi:acetolactate synthase-1/2/3 large subunit
MLEEWTPRAPLKHRPGAPTGHPDPAAIDRVADLICQADSPVIVADSAGRTPAGFNALVSLAESRGIPVFEGEGPTYNNFPKSHPLHHGYDLKREMDRFDLFLVIGNRAPWYPPSAGPEATVVVIDEYPVKEYMVYQDLQADFYVEGALPVTLAKLDAAVRERSDGAAPELSHGPNPVWERYRALDAAASSASPIDPGFLCNTISETLPSNTVFVDETILHRAQILRRIALDNPLSYMRPSGGLGQGLGITLGAKLAAPERPVTALIGDGSFLYNPITQSLGVARESNLPILIVVFNNASYAAMKSLHHSFYPEGTSVQSGIYYGVDIPGPDYSELAKPFGGHGERVEDPARLRGALEEAQAAVDGGNVAIVDVVLSA